MAELALLASIVQVADVGLRLSLRLFTFGETVASADRSILSISKDVSFTSSVLKELERVFEDDKAHIHSDDATKTAEAVVRECSDVFQEMDGLLLKKVPDLKPGFMTKKARAGATEAATMASYKGEDRATQLQVRSDEKYSDSYVECNHICTASLKKVGLRMLGLMAQKPLMTVS